MDIVVLTLFPEMIESYINESIISRGIKNNKLNITTLNIRDFADNKHGQIDDYIYGGGAGMLIQAEPVYKSILKAKELIGNDSKVIYFSPIGKTLIQEDVKKYSQYDKYILLCGHYEGIDERVLESQIDEYISIGDYILTGGELPALAFIDSISRYIPGVLHNDESTDFESFNNNLLEYPQYTRPEIWNNIKVPEVLLSGNHKKIDEWRLNQSIKRTKQFRNDLYLKYKEKDNEK